MEDIDLDVDMEKIRVMSAGPQPGQTQQEQPGGEEEEQTEEGQEEQHEVDQSAESEYLEESEQSEEQEQEYTRPVRVRKPPKKYGHEADQPEGQNPATRKNSPRARKRAQSWAKFSRKKEGLRTEMRIKDRWETADH